MKSTLFWEELAILDYAYLDTEGRVWGNSARVQATLTAPGLDEGDMVVDFSVMKQFLRARLEERSDHTLWVNPEQWPVSTEHGTVELRTPHLVYRAPEQAFFHFQKDPVDFLTSQLQTQLYDTFPERHFQLHLTLSQPSGPRIQYTHGLRKHAGHCQRLLHGHLSPLAQPFAPFQNEVFTFLEKKYHGKHFVSQQDVVRQDRERLVQAYESGQGEFQLEMNSGLCVVFDHETTIEQIAQTVQAQLERYFPLLQGAFYLREGLTKGSIIQINNLITHGPQ